MLAPDRATCLRCVRWARLSNAMSAVRLEVWSCGIVACTCLLEPGPYPSQLGPERAAGRGHQRRVGRGRFIVEAEADGDDRLSERRQGSPLIETATCIQGSVQFRQHSESLPLGIDDGMTNT